METRNELLTRIQEYKTDFACYTYSCFNAFARIKKIEEKREKRIKTTNFISLALSVLSVSAFMSIATDLLSKEWSVMIATLLGFVSVLLNIHSLLSNAQRESYKYLMRAERVNILWKDTRNTEALIGMGRLSEQEIIEKLEYYQSESKKHAQEPLYISSEDYELARKQLADGQKSYTSDELNK